MNKNTFLILLSLIVITGCPIMARPYQNTTGNDTAQLTIIKPQFGIGMFAHTYAKSENCEGRYLIDYLYDNPKKTVSIPANKDFTFSLTSLASNTTHCNLIATFTPIKGKKYFTSMAYDPNKEGHECTLILDEEYRAGMRQPVQSVYLRDYGGSRLHEDSTWCGDIIKSNEN